jgi:hypothetical protein
MRFGPARETPQDMRPASQLSPLLGAPRAAVVAGMRDLRLSWHAEHREIG